LICPVCGWQDDPVQNKRPDNAGGANHISLDAARKAYAEGKSIDELNDEAWDLFEEFEEIEDEESLEEDEDPIPAYRGGPVPVYARAAGT